MSENETNLEKLQQQESTISTKKKKKRLRKKAQSDLSEPASKIQQATQVDHPEALDNTNFYAIQAFEASINDTIINNAFQRAILDNKHLFVGKVALHLTEGVNCLYSLFAAMSGCAKVYCVIHGAQQKQAQNILMAQEIVKENGLQQTIQIVGYKMFNAEVDIIIAEPMGYCLYYDGLLDRIIELRDLYLVKGGIIFPNNISFKCALISDEYFLDQKVQFWNNVYGVKMTSIKKWVACEPTIRIVDPTLIVSEVVKFISFDIETIPYNELIKTQKQFSVPVLTECISNGIVFWFEVNFTHGPERVQIKASPWCQDTKYTQATLYSPQMLHYKSGQKVQINFKGQKHPKKGYSDILLKIDNVLHRYSFK